MATDLEIAQGAELKPIDEIAKQCGVERAELEPYGYTKAKVNPVILKRLRDQPDGRLVVVTAITPTPLGEGKTVTTIGASLGLARLSQKVFTCIRQPSMGPVFGIKGGAAGGGHSQVVPMEDFNLHLTGDIHAISAAHNLGAAALDSRMYHEERSGYGAFEKRSGLAALRIDPEAIAWRRVVDMNDRALRHVKVGLASPGQESNENGIPRSSGFDITVASELMAILALAGDLQDMRARIGKIIMAYDKDGKPITAEALGVAGAMTVLMRETIKPTLMQTLEHTPCFVHAGPFANIAHGNSSVIADTIALKLADYVVTESGFGSDMGFEKFCNIKARVSGRPPDAVVMVATLRALKMHSGHFRIVAGRKLDRGLTDPNPEALEQGICNLEAHINVVRRFGVPVVVALNRFQYDTDEELAMVCQRAVDMGAHAGVVSNVHARGGEGGTELGQAIIDACGTASGFETSYDDDLPLVDKIRKIATSIYRAGRVNFEPLAARQLKDLTAAGFGNLPVCMAKTHLSMSHDPELKGNPTRYEFPVREVRLSAGAGFVYVLAGRISTMPGLGSNPSYASIDIDGEGNIQGLF